MTVTMRNKITTAIVLSLFLAILTTTTTEYLALMSQEAYAQGTSGSGSNGG